MEENIEYNSLITRCSNSISGSPKLDYRHLHKYQSCECHIVDHLETAKQYQPTTLGFNLDEPKSGTDPATQYAVWHTSQKKLTQKMAAFIPNAEVSTLNARNSICTLWT